MRLTQKNLQWISHKDRVCCCGNAQDINARHLLEANKRKRPRQRPKTKQKTNRKTEQKGKPMTKAKAKTTPQQRRTEAKPKPKPKPKLKTHLLLWNARDVNASVEACWIMAAIRRGWQCPLEGGGKRTRHDNKTRHRQNNCCESNFISFTKKQDNNKTRQDAARQDNKARHDKTIHTWLTALYADKKSRYRLPSVSHTCTPWPFTAKTTKNGRVSERERRNKTRYKTKTEKIKTKIKWSQR